jgi:hypothetical protein
VSAIPGLRAMPQSYREAMMHARGNAFMARYAMPRSLRPDFAYLARHDFSMARRIRELMDDPFFTDFIWRGRYAD